MSDALDYMNELCKWKVPPPRNVDWETALAKACAIIAHRDEILAASNAQLTALRATLAAAEEQLAAKDAEILRLRNRLTDNQLNEMDLKQLRRLKRFIAENDIHDPDLWHSLVRERDEASQKVERLASLNADYSRAREQLIDRLTATGKERDALAAQLERVRVWMNSKWMPGTGSYTVWESSWQKLAAILAEAGEGASDATNI